MIREIKYSFSVSAENLVKYSADTSVIKKNLYFVDEYGYCIV